MADRTFVCRHIHQFWPWSHRSLRYRLFQYFSLDDGVSVSDSHFAISRRELGFIILEVFIETPKAADRGWRADL
jgi:hypothetical protein